MTMLIAVYLAHIAQPIEPVTCPLPDVKEFLSANVETRRVVMKHVDVCASAAPETTFDLIAAGLSDTDRQVRVTAAASVRTLQSAITRLRVDPRVARTIEPPNSLLNALAQSIDSTDVEVRHRIIEALVDFDADRSRTKGRLLKRYEREDVPLLRASLLMHLRGIAPDDATVRETVLNALDDSSSPVLQQGIIGARLWTPDSALPKLGDGLDAADLAVRMACVEALAAYGPRAKAFVERLQQLLEDETNPRRRRQIEAAITAITRISIGPL